MSERRTILTRVSGRDRPGITAGLLATLENRDVEIYDMEQVVVRERLTLDVLLGVGVGDDALKDLLFWAWKADVHLEFEVVESESRRGDLPRFAVTALCSSLTPAALRGVTQAIADGGGNIDRIVRLSRYPVVSYEFVVVDGDLDRIRSCLVEASRTHGVDVAVQRESLERRAKRLVVLDVDSTLIQNEVIDLLAEEAGCLDEVRAITERAMAGELDFETSLRERVSKLAGTPAEALERAAARLELTKGARTFVRTLKRLGYRVAIVSGGFQAFTDRLADDLGLDHAEANVLEIVDGVLTGELLGPIVDRARKATFLREIAEREGIPLEQTVAVGDGANDLDMLAIAGLGIAFNAKPLVKEQADTAVSVPFLDAILFLLGIPRSEIERADRADPAVADREPIPVPGTPPL